MLSLQARAWGVVFHLMVALPGCHPYLDSRMRHQVANHVMHTSMPTDHMHTHISTRTHTLAHTYPPTRHVHPCTKSTYRSASCRTHTHKSTRTPTHSHTHIYTLAHAYPCTHNAHIGPQAAAPTRAHELIHTRTYISTHSHGISLHTQRTCRSASYRGSSNPLRGTGQALCLWMMVRGPICSITSPRS